VIFITVWFPLAIYCLTLSYVNRSRHPVMVRGTWDAVGLLFALSGFLLLGGPAILNGFYEQRRLAWVAGQHDMLPGLDSLPWAVWAAVWVGYFVAVAGLSARMIWRRRNDTCIYNVEHDAFELSLAKALEHLGLAGTRTADAVVIEPDAAEPGRDPARPLLAGGTSVVLEIEASPAMRNVTLSWPEEVGFLRTEVERELARVFEDVPSGPNHAAAWLLAVALIFMCLTFVGMLFLLATMLFRGLR
jgi:hypothetical protein